MEIPENAPMVYVSFSAGVDPSTTEGLIAVMANCANRHVQTVCLLISTPGGNVREGLNLFNVLKGMPFELITHNVGNVDSIGNAVFLAGEKRYATPTATFMFHGVGLNAGNKRFEQKDLEETLDSLLSDQQRIGYIINQRTLLTEEEVKGLFRQAQTKNAQFAVDKGIIHEIRDVNIPKGSPIITLVFKR